MNAIRQIMWKVCCLIAYSCRIAVAIKGPMVETDSGIIMGLSYTLDHLNLSGEAFLGVPYAKPPLDDLRFRYPVKAERWKEIRNCSSLPNSCYQVTDNFFGNFPGATMWNPNTPLSEDCLYLNIWTPSSAFNSRQDLAVLVWIYGGGFYSGTSTLDIYDGKILASMNDVIVVSISYRLGVLGFLCLDDASAPCNVGMFDQLMALEWINDNIKYFGGDPDRITLWGESAGAASVSLHLLSPLSSHLFNRAILQSGTANMHWATTDIQEAMRRSREFAVNYMNCDPRSSSEMLSDCLRSKDASELVENQWVSRGILQLPFIPAVDGIFLVEPPHVSLKHQRFKQCPIVIGTNLNEASYFLVYELAKYLPLGKERNITRQIFLESIRQLFYHYPQYRYELNSTFLLDAVAFQYTDWLDPDSSVSNIRGLDRAVSDCYFICPSNEFAAAFSEKKRAKMFFQESVRVFSSFGEARYITDNHHLSSEAIDSKSMQDYDQNFELKFETKINPETYAKGDKPLQEDTQINHSKVAHAITTEALSTDETSDINKVTNNDSTSDLSRHVKDNPAPNDVRTANVNTGVKGDGPTGELSGNDYDETAGREETIPDPFGVYSYHFTERYRSNPWPQWMGVLHADEILFTFGVPLSKVANFTENEKQLSRVVMLYWTNFAKTGNPNGAVSGTEDPLVPILIKWPQHSSTGREYLELNSRHWISTVISGPHAVKPSHDDTRHSTLESNEDFLEFTEDTGPIGRRLRAKSCAFWSEYIPKLLAGTVQSGTSARERREELERWTERHHLDPTQLIASFQQSEQSTRRGASDECDET